jgi:cytochrome P450
MTETSAIELYYDPFDVEIDSDPYPVWKRMREEAPLYYNEKYNFYALSRYEDVARELPNWETYRSGRGTTADILFANIEVPPGILLFEDPCTICIAACCPVSSRLGGCWPWSPWCVDSASASWTR